MRIFRIPNDAKMGYGRLVGFHSSSDMDAMITLSSINKRMSRSALLRHIVSDWFKRRSLSLEKLVPVILEHAYHSWEADYKILGEEKKTRQTFKKALRQDLSSRSLPDELVEEIVSKFDDYVEQYKRTNEKKSGEVGEASEG